MLYSGFWSGVASAMVCVAAVVAVELIIPRTRYSLRSRLFGLGLCLTGTILASLLIPPLQYLWQRVGIGPLVHLNIGFVAAVASLIVLMDFLSYWRHRFLHAFMWRVHAVHHSVTDLHAANSYAHFLEPVANLAIVLIPLSLIDFGGFEVPMAALLFLSILQLYIHSPVTLELPRAFMVDNRFHRLHHSLEPRHFDRNFGIVFSVWDRVFGTAYMPSPDEWPDTGVAGIPPPRSFTDFLTFPLSSRFRAEAPLSEPQAR